MKCPESTQAAASSAQECHKQLWKTPARYDKPDPHIHGLSPEDSWEAVNCAKYRTYCTNAFVTRLYNSEPDLVHRRQPDFIAPRLHRRSVTLGQKEARYLEASHNGVVPVARLQVSAAKSQKTS